ncbi:MAG: DUF4364 family protein [Eubacterium sp.]|nr:DUF4364 family protein [Eubacterium sp.]
MDEMFLYKIIILYMLDRIDEYTLTNTQLANFMQGHGLPNNFNMHEALSEMIELGFISVTTIRDTQHYKITNPGEEALYYFENHIPNSTKQEILDYFKKEQINLRKESEIYADYYPADNQEFTVECVIKERKDTLMNLKFNVPTKGLAVSICDNWRAKSTDVYNYLMKELAVANPDTEHPEPESPQP